jgi:hypothetical protein
LNTFRPFFDAAIYYTLILPLSKEAVKGGSLYFYNVFIKSSLVTGDRQAKLSSYSKNAFILAIDLFTNPLSMVKAISCHGLF